MPVALFTPTILYLTGGLVIWAVRFLAVYSFTAIACSRGWDAEVVQGIGLVPLGIGIATAAAVAASAVLLLGAAWRLRKMRSVLGGEAENRRFVQYSAGGIAALAILSILWEVVPLYFIPICR